MSWRAWLVGGLAGLAMTAQAQEDGKDIFQLHCSACHQPDGSGAVGLAPPLRGAHWQVLSRSADYVPTVLTKGLSGRIQVEGQTFVSNMPSFASQLDDAQIVALLRFLNVLQNVPERPVDVEQVARVRMAAGNPTQTRQLRESLLQGR